MRRLGDRAIEGAHAGMAAETEHLEHLKAGGKGISCARIYLLAASAVNGA